MPTMNQVDWTLSESSAPATTPITTAEAKDHLRLTHSDHDTLIDTLIEAVTTLTQDETARQWVTATKVLKLSRWPDVILLPRTPAASVTSIRYIDPGGTDLPLSTSVFELDTASLPNRIYLGHNKVWPSIRNQLNAISVTFVAGYGDASAVPDQAKAAIKIIVAHFYENTEPGVQGGLPELALNHRQLLAPLTVWWF